MADLNVNLGNVIIDPNLISLDISRKSNSSKPSNIKPIKATPIPPITSGKIQIQTKVKPVYLNFQYKPNTRPSTPGIDLKGNFPQFVKKLALEAVIPGSKTKAKVNKPESSNFYITFVDADNILRTFVFSLMPAIETSLRGNNTGITVPEVKPGISFRTDMNTKKIAIPGARPVFQSLSIDKTIIQITAALIGNEEVVTRNKEKDAKAHASKLGVTTNVKGNELNANTGANFAPVSKRFDAWSSAAYIDSNIVQAGRPITLTIKSNTSNIDIDSNISIRCLFQSFRYLARYQDRCYYSLDLLSIDYQDKAAVNIAKTFTSKL
jgi:hypothetical protein